MPVSTSIKTRSALTALQRRTLAKFAQGFKLAIRQQGTFDLINGNVENVRFNNGLLTGGVKNTARQFQVTWKDLGNGWQNGCDCTAGTNCQHAYAVAHFAIQHESSIQAGGSPGAVTPVVENMDDRLDHLVSLVSSRKKEVPSPQRSIITKILDARSYWDVKNLLADLCAQHQIPFDENGKTWMPLFQTDQRDRRAWMLARELLRHGALIPEELEEFRHHRKFEEEENRRNQDGLFQMVEEWTRQLTPRSVKTQRTLYIQWSWESIPLGQGPQMELFISGKKLKNVLRTPRQVRGFASITSRSDYLFGTKDRQFLHWFESFYSSLVEPHPHPDREVPLIACGKSLHLWLITWGQSQRCFWPDGSPVAYSNQPVWVVPEIEPGTRKNTSHLSFRIQKPDGTRIPLEKGHLILPREHADEHFFACLDGVFHPVQSPPSIDMLRLFMEKPHLPISHSALAQILPSLVQHFPHLSQSCGSHIHHHPVRISFTFNLQPNDWLCVRLHARSKESRLRWEYTHQGWVPSDEEEEIDGKKEAAPGTSTLPPEPGFIHLPQPDDLEPSSKWLDGLDLSSAIETSFDPEHGWWTLLDGDRIDALIRHWGERPPKTDFWANPAFRALIDPLHRSTPKIQIRSSGMDWFSISAKWESLSSRLSGADIQKLLQTGEKFIKLSNGHWVNREEAEKCLQIHKALAQIGIDPHGEEHQQLSIWQMVSGGVSLDRLASLLDTDPESVKVIKELHKQIEAFSGIPDVPLPSRMRAQLRNYQMDGLRFLAYVSSLKLGAVLADDMGLGKTLQALAWLEHLRDREGSSPCLVICPASVVHNWQREASRFVEGSRTLLLTSGEARHGLRKEIPGYDFVITNYALLRRDLDELKQFKFRAVILDEAQYIKNPDSQVARAAKQLTATHRMALTGTPLENRLLDLWSIVDFIAPGYLGTRNKFVENYDQADQPHRRALLSSRLRPILLRRLKREVAPDLPERIEERHDCELTDAQKLFYLSELKQAREMLSELDGETAFNRKKIHVLAALTRLRQICCHPSLVHPEKKAESGKTAALMDILESLVEGGHKVLIFSQFVRMLNILEGELNQRSIPYHMLTGQTARREQVVQAFQQDPRPSVFLLSLKAAGTGLNLTAASYVILYDPWWNPAVEAQAIDRSHRIGQDRTVITYRLVARGTVEDKIYQLQQKKSAMIRDVLGEEGFASSLTREDLQFLFQD